MSKILQKIQKLSQKTLFIIIAVLLVLLVTSGVLVYSYFGNFNNSKLGLSGNSNQNSTNLSNSGQILANEKASNSNSNTNSQNPNSISNSRISSNNSVSQNEKIQLETAILEQCDLVIKYNSAKYYVVQSEDIYSVGTKLEIREKNIATNNDSLLLYQCNSDNYKFGNVSDQLQKLYPSSNFKIPLFENFFWEKTVEAGVIEFPGNVALRPKEEFQLDWLKVEDNPNFQVGIKTTDGRTIFHQMTFRNNPIIWNGENLQIGLNHAESKQTKPILSPEEYKKIANEEKILDSKKVKKFQNFEKIKFEGKVNKISDIPNNLLDKYGIPQFGFRFYKGVVFWTGYRSNSQEYEDSVANFQKKNPMKEKSFFNEGIIAYDGTNVVEIKDEVGKEIQNYFGHSLGVYYLSGLIKDGIGYNFGQNCGGWGCNIAPGFFIDFEKGEYWVNKDGINTENSTLQNTKNIQPYLDYDFKVWNGLSPKIIGDTGYKIHQNGKIYGKFQKYISKDKEGNPVSEGDFLVESDGENYKFISKVPKSACANPMGSCSDNIAFNSRGNVVYYGNWYTAENELPKENLTEKENSQENPKMKFIEQDFATGKVLQEDISIKNDEILKKFGLNKINL